jgi:hypothetical protein
MKINKMESIEYLKNSSILRLLENSEEYQKNAITLIRLIKKEEVGQSFKTYVADENGLRVESTNLFTEDKVVARNQNPIGFNNNKDIFNEWLIPLDVFIKNYGPEAYKELSCNKFTPLKKIAKVKAIEITQKVLDDLNIKEDFIPIKVSWSTEPMIAKLGDYLTNEGYSISKDNMKDYEFLKEA